MLLLFMLGLIEIICHGQSTPNCVFKDGAGSGRQLDLRALAFTELKMTDGLTPPNEYEYTPCRNAITCEPDTAMAVKLQKIPEDTCFVMANWDSEATLPYYNDIEEKWTFNYTTGNKCGGEPYTFYVNLYCDPNGGDYKVVSAETIANCTSDMNIDTKWACPGEIYTTPMPEDNSSLSG